jgi:ATP-dependent Clp protease ATP-binding subunit ClpA
MFERFTDRARQVVVTAREAAVEERATSVDTGHLLIGVLADPACLAVQVLEELGVPAQRLRDRLASSGADVGAAGLDDAELQALRAIGIDAEEVVRRAETELGTRLGPPTATTGPHRVPFGADAKKVLELSLREALAMKHRWIGTEHLLLGLLREGRGRAHAALVDAGVDHRQTRTAILRALTAAG